MSHITMYRANIEKEDFKTLFYFDEKMYFTGDRMECVIKLDPLANISVIWLNVKIIGKFSYRFNPQMCDEPIFRRDLLDHQTFSYGRKGGAAHYLDPYTFQIAFRYLISRDLPTSLRSNNGKVLYFVELNALRSNNRQYQLQCPFRVIHRVELPRELLPSQDMEKYMMCCCKTYCHLKLSTPQQAYLRGDEISLKVEVTCLRRGQCRLRDIRYTLVRYYEYKVILKEVVLEDVILHTEHGFSYIMSNQSIGYGDTKTYVGCVRIPDDCLPTYENRNDNYCKYMRITYAIEFKAKLRKWLINLPVVARLPIRICTEVEEGSMRSDEYPFLHLGPHPIRPIPLSELDDDTLGGRGMPVGGEMIPMKKLTTVQEDTAEASCSNSVQQDVMSNDESQMSSPVLHEVNVAMPQSKDDDSSESNAPEVHNIVATVHHSKEVESEESSTLESGKDDETNHQEVGADAKPAGDDLAETTV
ncbi:uncharacterized protein LOC129801785 isoform X1 [Phlebotomus papatasi]|uniref:uncharacterized protein LOC129801785 isoform X1 n=2 Tax=Phlebotomus papatasi TaxID=29031 RepID=UPI0024844D55|nr:uncharacterized protein LOC129801785 isoform X1 [Phlebotomus papatasi]